MAHEPDPDLVATVGKVVYEARYDLTENEIHERIEDGEAPDIREVRKAVRASDCLHVTRRIGVRPLYDFHPERDEDDVDA